MSGFGDGTGWSSERGNTPGYSGSKGNAGNGGNNGNGGNGANVGEGGTMTIDMGDGHTMTFEGVHGLIPGMEETVGGNAGNSGMSPAVQEANKKAIKKTMSPVWAMVPGKPGMYTSPGQGAVTVSKSTGVSTYTSTFTPTASAVVTVKNGDLSTAMVSYVNWKGPHGNAGNIAVDKAKQIIDYEKAVSAVADFFKTLTKLHGDKLAKEAKYFAEQSVGKVIRNRTQALQAFDRYKNNLIKKFSAADRIAIANALSSLNAEKMSQQLKIYGKAFGLVGDFIQYSALAKGLAKGFKTGDWNDAIVSAESIVISKAAGALAAFAFAAMTTTALGILGFTMIMVIMGALITDQLIKQINDFMLSL